ncbi:RdgB/HAM1 family non-canonical purine NTP pyrophosphatase [Alteromonas sp. ASW11-36]|uniref:dITP/XTP pyrophosphatase n=1 Tax=Alteromonas arenosi TaxID=3055817 RepID=A0ABT7T0G8_9ALTE|nr:RdgB/HAM1 family non-canonical purine NTP pyrophosphatase [Alteromonas sp. ASW11-36]MDM7861939.1 RdgB/HAM1 family non-canonical purine NTP pyrophosphatase [Alteromonas sp. ASW11-36]
MKQIVLATGNPGKVAEFEQLFAKHNVVFAPQSEYQVSEVAETGTTFVENAIIKARHAAAQTGLPAIADDSGLVVDALQGQPGIYSSRYAGDDATDDANIDKLLSALDGRANRRAHFYCCLVFMRHAADPVPIVCEGYWWGEIDYQRRGDGGFGYDPVFYLPSLSQSAAQLSKSEKSAISHRGQALAALIEKMRDSLA